MKKSAALSAKAAAKCYATSERQVYRWRAREAPLENPRLMLEFLATQKPRPQETIALLESNLVAVEKQIARALKGKPVTTPKLRKCRKAKPVAIAAPSVAHSEEPPPPGEFLAGEVVELRKAVHSARQHYERALAENLSGIEVQNRQRNYSAICDTLRKMESAVPNIRRENDLTIDKTEVEMGVAATLIAFRGAANRLPRRAAPKLVGIRDHGEICTILEREVEVLLRSLMEMMTIAQATNRPPVDKPSADDDAERTQPI